MAVAQVLARLRNEPLANCPIATAIEQLCRECDHLWRDRVLTPAVTLRLFLLQVLHGNTAIAHLRQLRAIGELHLRGGRGLGRLPMIREPLVELAHRRAREVGVRSAEHRRNAFP